MSKACEEIKLDKQDRKNLAKAMSMMSQIAFTIISCVGISVFIGYWVDRLFGTEPIFIIVMSLFGVVSAIWGMVKLAQQF